MKNLDRPLRPEDAGAEPIPFDNRTRVKPEVFSESARANPDGYGEAPRPMETPESLISKRQVEELRSRWDTVQGSFIDEPRKAVRDADALVAAAVKEISEGFSDQRNQLEKQWNKGDEISTEDLRLALQRYRAFFSRLLSI
jgi:hypothetical protein